MTVSSCTKSLDVACLCQGSHNPLKGVYYATALNRTEVMPAMLRQTDFRAMRYISDLKIMSVCPMSISISCQAKQGGSA